MSLTSKKVSIFLLNEIPTIWNDEDWRIIRKHRVRGTPIGPLPKFEASGADFGLPLRLLEAEAKLLHEKEIGEIFHFPPVEEIREKFNEKHLEREKNINIENREVAIMERKMEVLKVAEKIVEGKKKKLEKDGEGSGAKSELTVEKVVEEELQKLNLDTEFVEMNIEYPFISELSLTKAELNYPASERDKLKYAVYKDLWEKDFCVTSGIKFGGDYLVYKGDPDSCHSTFIIKCVGDDEKMSTLDMIASIRLGTITKKTLVIASVENNTVHYLSFQWGGEEFSAPFQSASGPSTSGVTI